MSNFGKRCLICGVLSVIFLTIICINLGCVSCIKSFFGMILSVVLCNVIIKKSKNILQPIRHDGPKSHISKIGTPTFGGVAIVLSTFFLTMIFTKLDKKLLFGLFVFISFAIIGFVDDYMKIKKHNSKGIKGKIRFFLECIIAIIAYSQIDITTTINFPFFGQFDIGWMFPAWFTFILVGSSNAVNLADGLDGLVMGPVCCISAMFLCIAWHTNEFQHVALVQYLIFAGLGFLYFNINPAKIFMGDTGALAIGSLLGYTALLLNAEICLAIAGAFLVLETLSDIIQVVSYKTRKKRVFKMAPFHHHLELCGWSEKKIVANCWTISIFCTIVALLAYIYG